jgi:hypothetical protein
MMNSRHLPAGQGMHHDNRRRQQYNQHGGQHNQHYQQHQQPPQQMYNAYYNQPYYPQQPPPPQYYNTGMPPNQYNPYAVYRGSPSMPYQQYQVPPVVSTPSYPLPLQPPAVVTTPYQPHVPTTPSSTRSSYIAPATIPAPAVPPPLAEVVAPAQLPPTFIPQLSAPLTPPVQEAPQFPAETPEEETSETRIPYWPQVSNPYLTHKTRSDFISSRGTRDPTCHGQPGQRNKRNERLCPSNQRWLSKMISSNPAKVTRRSQTPLTLLRLPCLAPRLHPQHKLPPNMLHRQIPQPHLLPRQLYNLWSALQNLLIATCLLQ